MLRPRPVGGRDGRRGPLDRLVRPPPPHRGRGAPVGPRHRRAAHRLPLAGLAGRPGRVRRRGLPLDALLRLRRVHRLRPRARRRLAGRLPRAAARAPGRTARSAAAVTVPCVQPRPEPVGRAESRMRVRLRFTKLGKVRFTSHRDVARMWERAFRRADGPRRLHARGSPPGPSISFGLALSTGYESLGEYLDVELAPGTEPRPRRTARSAHARRSRSASTCRRPSRWTARVTVAAARRHQLLVAHRAVPDVEPAAAEAAVRRRPGGPDARRHPHPQGSATSIDDLRPASSASPWPARRRSLAGCHPRRRAGHPTSCPAPRRADLGGPAGLDALRSWRPGCCAPTNGSSATACAREPLPLASAPPTSHLRGACGMRRERLRCPSLSTRRVVPPVARAAAPAATDGDADTTSEASAAARRRRRGSRRRTAAQSGAAEPTARRAERERSRRRRPGAEASTPAPTTIDGDRHPSCPTAPSRAGRSRPEVAERGARARRPQIGDTRCPRRPTPPAAAGHHEGPEPAAAAGGAAADGGGAGAAAAAPARAARRAPMSRDRRAVELDEETLARQRGRERKGRPIGRYLMCVHVTPGRTQIAVLEGRTLIEHYVSRPADDIGQIHGNIYLGRVQNVLPGMEAAFVDIGTPKNAVLYRGDVQYDQRTSSSRARTPRIEQMLKAQQIDRLPGHEEPDRGQGRPAHARGVAARAVRGADPELEHLRHLEAPARRRAQAAARHPRPGEAGRARRDRAHRGRERRRGRDRARRRAACSTSGSRSRRWRASGRRRRCSTASPTWRCGSSGRSSTGSTGASSSTTRCCSRRWRATSPRISPALADRVEYYDAEAEGLPLFERFHVHEQLHKALDRKVWLPSGGSLIIEHTEALTVIDVNTGKNVGTSNLEETVFHNNLEAADEIARQLRLRDIGGIIVIDFIDMEIRENRQKVVGGVPRGPGPGQDPHAGVRHLRPRPRRDDPQAHRRGPARVLRRPVPDLRGPRRHRRPRALD